MNEVSTDEEQVVPNTCEKLRKSQSVTEGCKCGKCGVMETDIECLSCSEVKTLGCFQLPDMRYDDIC